MTTPYTILYQREPEGGYTVWVEELKGCVTYGETFEEATSMIYDAMQGYLDVLAESSLRAKRGNLSTNT